MHTFIIERVDIQRFRLLNGIVCCPSDRTTPPKPRNYIDGTPNISQIDDDALSRAVNIEKAHDLIKARRLIADMYRLCAITPRAKGSGLKRFNEREILGLSQYIFK